MNALHLDSINLPLVDDLGQPGASVSVEVIQQGNRYGARQPPQYLCRRITSATCQGDVTLEIGLNWRIGGGFLPGLTQTHESDRAVSSEPLREMIVPQPRSGRQGP